VPEWLRWAFLIAFGILMFALAFIINEVSFEKDKTVDEEDPDWQNVGWVDSYTGALTPYKEKIMGQLTQEQINENLFEFVFEVSLIEGLRKDSVHKIREIFNEDRTTIWFLISGDTTVEVKGDSTTEFDVGDEVIVVTYHKKTGELCGASFEWTNALLSPKGMLF
jgi:hypothetical protein